MMNEKTWQAVIDYLDDRIHFNRKFGGKFNGGNEELYLLLLEMSKVDDTIRVPSNFGDFEEGYKDGSYNIKGEGSK